MAATEMTSFDSLSDEIALMIIKMAAGLKFKCGRDRVYNHDFLIDVLSKVSVRFRRLASNSSLWKDCVGVSLTILRNDFNKVDYLIRACLNSETKMLQFRRHSGTHHSFPNR